MPSLTAHSPTTTARKQVRIAMWSGPRTRSTAMMRAWENRPDTVVVDEPLYGFYLAHSDVDDPGQDEVLATCPTDWREIVDGLTEGTLPESGATVYYQKHLAQHLLPAVDRTALSSLRHAFLIRHPAQMLSSYAKVHAPTLDELGLRQQVQLYRMFGGPVVDANDLVERPEPVLRALCDALEVPFTPAMLSWPAGPRPTDGVWGHHWYEGVWQSTGFTAHTQPEQPAHEPSGGLPAHLLPVLENCMPLYNELRARRIAV